MCFLALFQTCVCSCWQVLWCMAWIDIQWLQKVCNCSLHTFRYLASRNREICGNVHCVSHIQNCWWTTCQYVWLQWLDTPSLCLLYKGQDAYRLVIESRCWHICNVFLWYIVLTSIFVNTKYLPVSASHVRKRWRFSNRAYWFYMQNRKYERLTIRKKEKKKLRR